MKKSKASGIEKHLRKHRRITPMVAWSRFGVYRLSSVINRLRDRGWIIGCTPTGNEGYATYTCLHAPEVKL